MRKERKIGCEWSQFINFHLNKTITRYEILALEQMPKMLVSIAKTKMEPTYSDSDLNNTLRHMSINGVKSANVLLYIFNN